MEINESQNSTPGQVSHFLEIEIVKHARNQMWIYNILHSKDECMFGKFQFRFMCSSTGNVIQYLPFPANDYHVSFFGIFSISLSYTTRWQNIESDSNAF